MITFLLALVGLALCVLGLGVSIFFKKGGTFPKTDIEKNSQMRQRGIRCPKEEECQFKKKCKKL